MHSQMHSKGSTNNDKLHDSHWVMLFLFRSWDFIIFFFIDFYKYTSWFGIDLCL